MYYVLLMNDLRFFVFFINKILSILQNYALVVNNILNTTLRHQWRNIEETTVRFLTSKNAFFADLFRSRDSNFGLMILLEYQCLRCGCCI